MPSLIGNKPNQVPSNGDLGTLAFQDANAVNITGGVANVSSLTNTGVTTVQAGTVSAPAITTTGDTNTGIFFPAADTIAFTEGGVEAMRINSSGFVGIGVTNPTRKLHVVQNATISTSSFDTSTFSQFLGTSGVSASTSLGFQATTADGSQGYAAITCVPTSNYRSGLIATYTGDAFGTGYFAINRYAATGSTSEVLRADSIGNVGIGTSSPSTRLSVHASNPTNGQVARLRNDTAGGNGTFLAFDLNSVGAAAIGIPNNTNALAFYANNDTTERMRIHPTGGVSIGDTTDPGTGALRITDNLVIGTSGKGIDFSATAGTGTSELLADYEEGGWSPGYTGWSTNPIADRAIYTKIGRQVTVTMIASGGVCVAGATISGLPFTSSANSGSSALATSQSNVVAFTGSIFNSSTSIANISATTMTGIYWVMTSTYFV